jgi:hypothetical protein
MASCKQKGVYTDVSNNNIGSNTGINTGVFTLFYDDFG